MSFPSLKLLLGELIGTVTADKDGLMSRDGFIEHHDITDANTMFNGFQRGIFKNSPVPSEYGLLVSLMTTSSVVCLQFFLRGWPVELYWRSNWDVWNGWKQI